MMTSSSQDTIAALASASGPAARGIIRISGPDTISIAAGTLQLSREELHPRQARVYEKEIQIGGIAIPATLMLWPTERSFTGEILAELHLPGSPPLLNEVLTQIWSTGARPAEPGEFTQRAFLAGRIDLTQAEAVLGVIDAGNTHQLTTALQQLAGGISGPIQEIRETLLLHLADLEAGLDFFEEDIEFVQRPAFIERLESAHRFLTRLLTRASSRMESSVAPRVVLAGLPNSGKSTLFNHLSGVDAALVSDQAGTTRDYLRRFVDLGALTIELVDVAGWEDARNEIEQAAGAQRQGQLQRADLVVWCQAIDMIDEERGLNEQLFEKCQEFSNSLIKVSTKVDLNVESTIVSTRSSDGIMISALTGSGISELTAQIVARLQDSNSDCELTGATAARCQESLRNAATATERALSMAQSGAGDELIAMELREILEHLGRVVGQVYTDDILDRIFSRFCIGK